MSKPSDGRCDVTFRISVEQKERLIVVAEMEGRSISNTIAQAVKTYIDAKDDRAKGAQ